MESKKYFLIKNEATDAYLAAIQIGRTSAIHPLTWTQVPKIALHFDNIEEAQATIKFIGAVLDWELEEQMEIYEIKESKYRATH